MLPELAHHIWAIPLLFLGGLHLRGQRRGVEWWWLAGAYGISWLANTAAHWVNPDVVGNAYPLSQAGLIGLVFLLRRDAMRLIGVLFVVGVAAVLWRGPSGADVLLYTVSHGAVVGIVLDRRALGRLRTALLVTFGLGLLAWWAYAFYPWSFWTRSDNQDMVFLVSNLGIYQLVSAVGIALFCFAALKPGPSLKVAQ